MDITSNDQSPNWNIQAWMLHSKRKNENRGQNNIIYYTNFLQPQNFKFWFIRGPWGFKKLSLKKSLCFMFCPVNKGSVSTKKKEKWCSIQRRKITAVCFAACCSFSCVLRLYSSQTKIRNWNMYKQCWRGANAMSDYLWNQSGVISTELHQFMGGDIKC